MDEFKNLIYRNGSDINSYDLYKFNESKYVFETALKILNTKLDIIKSEYDREKVHSDIQKTTSRIKSIESISKKLEKQGLEFTLDNIQATLNDVVGARIVCLTETDVACIVEMIRRIPSLKIINEKDYITNPKESGYRSYHIIVEIPVPLGNGTIVPIRGEIQIRTLLMDAWSSLEHEIIYKNKDCTKESEKSLKEYSYALSFLEREMESIRRQELDRQEEHPVEMRKIAPKELRKFKDRLYIYKLAGEILQTNIDIVKAEYERDATHSDIQYTKCRIKEINSIDTKLAQTDKAFTIDNIKENIKDVVAARVVCLDIDDVYKFVELFKSYPGIKIVEEKDYIANPKESGYRAYHIIVDIPVELSTGVETVRCEVQFRTVLMDAWSSLEHETIYKNIASSDEAKRSLKDYSSTLATMDRSMVNIKRTELENLSKVVQAENEAKLNGVQRIDLTSVDGVIQPSRDVKVKSLTPKREQ